MIINLELVKPIVKGIKNIISLSTLVEFSWKSHQFDDFFSRLENFNNETAFSIIFKPETNKRELDLVAETQEIR